MSKSWVFTFNNPDDIKHQENAVRLRAYIEDKKNITRAVIGLEQAETGTPHWQGAVTFRKNHTLLKLRKLFGERHGPHWETTKAQAREGDAAFVYCRKEGNILMDVDYRAPGKRSDLERVALAVKAGEDLRSIANEYTTTYIRYGKGIRDAHRLLTNYETKSHFPRASYDSWIKMEILSHTSLILSGPPGLGKTEWSLAHFEHALLCTHLEDLARITKDTDGIVFDDMNFTHLHREAQIHIMERRFSHSIHVRYQNVSIPTGMPCIFTTNVADGAIVNIDDPAITRRTIVLTLSSKVFEGSPDFQLHSHPDSITELQDILLVTTHDDTDIDD